MNVSGVVSSFSSASYRSASLFSFGKKKKDKKEEDQEKLEKLKKKIKSDKYAEAYIRNHAIADARIMAFKIYDTFKKSLGMATPPYGHGDPIEDRSPPTSKADELFGF